MYSRILSYILFCCNNYLLSYFLITKKRALLNKFVHIWAKQEDMTFIRGFTYMRFKVFVRTFFLTS